MVRILVGTDFSTRSDRAMRRAVILAKSLTAEIALLNVVDEDQPQRRRDADISSAKATLADLCRGLLELDGAVVSSQVVIGDAFAKLVEAAQELPADLLVLGPHRRRIFSDAFRGTTAERVIRIGTCPVLTANAPPAAPYRKIMIAVDLGHGATPAIKVLRALKLDQSAELTLLHVITAPQTGLMVRASYPMHNIEAHLAEQLKAARKDLAEIAKEHGLDAGATDVRVAGDGVAATINAAARALGADLIVVAKAGPSAINRLMLGSVAEAVLRTSETDVLAVPVGYGATTEKATGTPASD